MTMALTMMIAIAVITGFIGLAKRGRGRKFQKYIRGAIDERFALGTLAADTVIGSNFGGTVNERTFVSSIVALWSMDQFTPNSDDGPIIAGIAHLDYTDVEIEEWVENETGGWNEGDLVAQEIGKRKIRRVGVFSSQALTANESAVLNDGREIRTKCKWILLQGQTVKAWAYNAGSSALATTDPTMHVQGHANLWPR